MPNRISTAIEFTTESAKSSLASLRQSVNEADGAGGKFKAGFASLKQSVSENAGAVAAVAGAALLSFGIKAVSAFTNTAKAAIDLGTATGLSTEQASRWIGVADDMGVSAEALQAGIGKIGKTLDAPQWEKYGIATRDAGGHAKSTNDILLDSFDKLSKITNETERAKAGNALFGKGYASLSPLIGKSREEMEKYLGSVEKGQVITEQEAAKAEKFRLAQDKLSDAMHEVTLAVGQQVAALAPYIEKVAWIIANIGASDASVQLHDIFAELSPLANAATEAGKGLDYFIEQVQTGKMTLEEAKVAMQQATLSTDELKVSLKEQAAQSAETDRENRKLPKAWEDVRDAEAEATKAQQIYKYDSDNTKAAVKQNIDEMIGKWDELTGAVSDDKSWVTLQGGFADLQTKFEEANKAIKDGTDDAAAKALAYKGGLDDVTLSVIDYGKNILKLPPEKLVAIKTALDAGELQHAEDMLAILTRNRSINIDLVGKGAAGYNQGGGPSFDEGGVVPGPTGAPVAATVHGGEMVLTPDQQKAVGGNGGGVQIGEVHVHVQNMPTPNELIALLAKYKQWNGPGALLALTS